jgi:hypothetical protein
MKIAIIGAPESGKTVLAKRLLSRLNKDGGNYRLIDGYVEKLIKRTGLAYSHFATYPMNFQVLFERWTQELDAANTGYDTITCGSIYETTVYCALHNIRDTGIIPNAQDTLAYIEGKAMMDAISFFHFGTVDYDHIFRLPYTEEKLAAKSDDWDVVIDQKLPEVLEGSFQFATVLEGTLKEKADIAINIIKAIAVEQSQSNERATVGGSREPTEELEVFEEDLPDMRI